MSRRALWSLLPVALIIAAAIPGAWPLLRAPDIVTGSADWPAQVYRLEHLRTHGLATWTHDWAGGLPLWSGYQPGAHLLTAAAADLTGSGSARAMTVALALVTLAVPLALYTALRLLGLGALAALTAALLTLALDTRRQPMANFTELWGLALTPLVLALALRAESLRARLPAALLAGLAVYLHPLAGITGALGLLVAAALHFPQPLRSKAAARWAGGLSLQLAAWCGAAGFFLLPMLISVRPAYEEPYLSSADFARLLAQLQIAGFAPGWPLWLGLLAHATAWVAWRGPGPLRLAARFLLVLTGVVAILTLLSLFGWGPRLFRNAQLPRLLSLLPLLAATGGALALAALPPLSRRAALAIPAVLLPVAMLAGGPSFQRAPSGQPGTLASWVRTLPPTADGVSGRIAAGPELTAVATAAAPGRLWSTGSYSGQEWSLLGPPLASFMAGFGTPETRAAYLTAMSVQHVLVPRGARPSLVHPVSHTPLLWTLQAELAEGDVLRLPWRPPVAVVVPAGMLDGVDAPDSNFIGVEASYIRDASTRRTAALLLDPRAVAGTMQAPNPETLEVDLPPHASGTLLLTVNWDTAWRASAGGAVLPVRRAGPNYLAVELPATTAPSRVTIRHRTPWTWTAGALITLGTTLSVVAAVLAGPVLRRCERRGARSGTVS